MASLSSTWFGNVNWARSRLLIWPVFGSRNWNLLLETAYAAKQSKPGSFNHPHKTLRLYILRRPLRPPSGLWWKTCARALATRCGFSRWAEHNAATEKVRHLWQNASLLYTILNASFLSNLKQPICYVLSSKPTSIRPFLNGTTKTWLIVKRRSKSWASIICGSVRIFPRVAVSSAAAVGSAAAAESVSRVHDKINQIFFKRACCVPVETTSVL